MKDKKEAKAPKPSISRMVFKLITIGKLDTKEGKDEALKVISAVKKQFHRTKFDMTQYFWYLSRYRRQKGLGLPLTHLVVIVEGKAKPRKHGKSQGKSKVAAKKAVKTVKVPAEMAV